MRRLIPTDKEVAEGFAGEEEEPEDAKAAVGGGAREGGEEVAMAPGGAEEAGLIHDDAGPPHYDSPPITMPIDADKGCYWSGG